MTKHVHYSRRHCWFNSLSWTIIIERYGILWGTFAFDKGSKLIKSHLMRNFYSLSSFRLIRELLHNYSNLSLSNAFHMWFECTKTSGNIDDLIAWWHRNYLDHFFRVLTLFLCNWIPWYGAKRDCSGFGSQLVAWAIKSAWQRTPEMLLQRASSNDSGAPAEWDKVSIKARG